MRYSIAVLALWAIAVATTFVIVGNADVLTSLGPVYAICMIGSVFVVQRAYASRDGPAP